jgi:hypothetical protein
MKQSFKAGEEFIYTPPSKDSEPVWLTYVEKLKCGLHRLFSSESPVLEYHIPEESFSQSDEKKNPKPDVTVKYSAFVGGDNSKQIAYEKLLSARGIKSSH